MATVSYPYDPTGLSPANLVVNETQVLTAINNDPFRYFIPDFAPFYEVNFTATAFNTLGERITLRKDIDFHFSLRYIGATRANGKSTVGGIVVINKNVQGPVTLSYQTVGGLWAANRNYVIQTIAENNYNPRRVAWDQVTNAPDTFPPNDHTQDLDTFTGFRDLIDAVDRLAAASANTDTIRNELHAHILNKNDPHETMVNLPNTLIHRNEFEAHSKNFNDPHKTLNLLPSDIVRRTDLNTAIAPLATKSELSAHTDDLNDPHRTLSIVGLNYSTINYVDNLMAQHITHEDPHPVYYNLTRLKAFAKGEYKDDLPVKFFRINL